MIERACAEQGGHYNDKAIGGVGNRVTAAGGGLMVKAGDFVRTFYLDKSGEVPYNISEDESSLDLLIHRYKARLGITFVVFWPHTLTAFTP